MAYSFYRCLKINADTNCDDDDEDDTEKNMISLG